VEISSLKTHQQTGKRETQTQTQRLEKNKFNTKLKQFEQQ
jgi:hypothetical protein